MNFKKILASVAAAALAVSSMAVCSFAASDIECDTPEVTGTFDSNSGWAVFDLTAYNKWGTPVDLTGYEKVEMTYSVTDVGNATNIALAVNGGDIGWQDVKADLTVGDNQTLALNVADLTASGTTTIEAVQIQVVSTTATGEAFTGNITINSVKIIASAASGGDSGNNDYDWVVPSTTATEDEATEETTTAAEETTTTEEEAAPEAGTFEGSHTMKDSSWWTQDKIVDFEAGLTDLTVLIGDLDPATVTSITFTSDTAFFVGYNGKDGTWHQNDPAVTSLTLTDVLLVEDGDKAPALHIMISKGDGIEYTINWVVTTGDAPATTEDTSASEAAPEDTSGTSVVVEPDPVETTSEETNAGNSEDGNQPTGIVLAVIPAAVAVAGVIVSRKRS